MSCSALSKSLNKPINQYLINRLFYLILLYSLHLTLITPHKSILKEWLVLPGHHLRGTWSDFLCTSSHNPFNDFWAFFILSLIDWYNTAFLIQNHVLPFPVAIKSNPPWLQRSTAADWRRYLILKSAFLNSGWICLATNRAGYVEPVLCWLQQHRWPCTLSGPFLAELVKV